MSWQLKINITEENQTFGFMLVDPNGMNIDWGDGNSTGDITDSGIDIIISHSYLITDEYIVTVSGGTCYNIRINNGNERLIEVLNPVPDFGVTKFDHTFSACFNLSSIPVGLFDNNVNVTDFSFTFSACFNLSSIPVGLFDNNVNVTDFHGTFANCTSLDQSALDLTTDGIPLWERAGQPGFPSSIYGGYGFWSEGFAQNTHPRFRCSIPHDVDWGGSGGTKECYIFYAEDNPVNLVSRKIEENGTSKTIQTSHKELDPTWGFDYIISTTRPEIAPGRQVVDINLGDIGNSNDILVSESSSSDPDEARIDQDVCRSSLPGTPHYGNHFGLEHDLILKGRSDFRRGLLRVRENYMLCQRFTPIPLTIHLSGLNHRATPTENLANQIAFPFTYANIENPPPSGRVIGMMGSYGSSDNLNIGSLFVSSNLVPDVGVKIYLECMWLEQDGIDTILKASYVSSHATNIPSETVNVVVFKT